MNGKIALLIGTTGLVGSHLLNLILEDEYYREVRVLVRHSIAQNHEKLQQIVVDFDKLDDFTTKDIFQVDDVFCCIGTTIKKAKGQEQFRKVDFEYPLAVARLAKEAGATKFALISALGANAHSSILYNRVKGEVEEAIATVGYFSLHIFRPSLLLGQRQEFRLGEKIGQLFGGVCIGPLYRFKPVKATVVAAAMLKGIKNNNSGVQVYGSGEIARMGE